jgi:hypothetical protein
MCVALARATHTSPHNTRNCHIACVSHATTQIRVSHISHPHPHKSPSTHAHTHAHTYTHTHTHPLRAGRGEHADVSDAVCALPTPILNPALIASMQHNHHFSSNFLSFPDHSAVCWHSRRPVAAPRCACTRGAARTEQREQTAPRRAHPGQVRQRERRPVPEQRSPTLRPQAAACSW